LDNIENIDLSNLEQQICTIQYDTENLHGLMKASNFRSMPTILCKQLKVGSSDTLAVESLRDVMETKELVHAICTLFIAIIAIVWLQSSWMKFENENRSRPFHFHFLCNDIDVSSVDLWCHSFSNYASIVLILWRLFLFIFVSLHTMNKIILSVVGLVDTSTELEVLNLTRYAERILLVLGKKSSASFVLMKRTALIIVALIIFALG
jgi:hypothetical protein